MLRMGRIVSAKTTGTLARLVNLSGDNACFYHVIAKGLMKRRTAFPDLPKSPFSEDVGEHPGSFR